MKKQAETAKKGLSNLVMSVGTKVGEQALEQCCFFYFYEPEIPEKLQQLKK